MAGEKAEVKLIGTKSSPFVLRAKIALAMKGVEYEFLEETFNPKSDLLLRSNPVKKKVPVLLHNGQPICESLIIVEYVDEVWNHGPAILPADPHDRATARFWAAYVDEKFPCLMATLSAETDEERSSAADQLFAALTLLEEAFEKCSKGKPFFGGDSISYLDIALGCTLVWLRVPEKIAGVKFLDEEKFPSITKWAERFLEDKAVNGLVPKTESLVWLVENILKPRWAAAAAAAASLSPK